MTTFQQNEIEKRIDILEDDIADIDDDVKSSQALPLLLLTYTHFSHFL